MSEIALKPCPFCGSEARFWRTGRYGDGFRTAVKCRSCEARIPSDKCMTPDGAEREAAERWNRRAERTCRNVSEEPDMFQCSACGFSCDFALSYCGGCGAKVVEG